MPKPKPKKHMIKTQYKIKLPNGSTTTQSTQHKVYGAIAWFDKPRNKWVGKLYYHEGYGEKVIQNKHKYPTVTDIQIVSYEVIGQKEVIRKVSKYKMEDGNPFPRWVKEWIKPYLSDAYQDSDGFWMNLKEGYEVDHCSAVSGDTAEDAHSNFYGCYWSDSLKEAIKANKKK